MLKTEKICLCSSELPESAVSKLALQYRVIKLPPDKTVDVPVQCHPDMICVVMDGLIYFHESYAEAYPSVVSEIEKSSGCRAVITRGKRSGDYPYDISLNAAVLPNALVCCSGYTATELLTAAEKSGRRIITVKQGYSACSSIVSREAVLTSDIGIYRGLIRESIDCTYIPTEGILLPGYGCGFIGGCGGVCDGNLYIFGSPTSLAECDVLSGFAAKHSLDIVELTDAPLTDYGGLKFL